MIRGVASPGREGGAALRHDVTRGGGDVRRLRQTCGASVSTCRVPAWAAGDAGTSKASFSKQKQRFIIRKNAIHGDGAALLAQLAERQTFKPLRDNERRHLVAVGSIPTEGSLVDGFLPLFLSLPILFFLSLPG